MKNMKKDHLNNCLLLHCHKSITGMLNMVDIAKEVCLYKWTIQDNLENTSRESTNSLMMSLPIFQNGSPPQKVVFIIIFSQFSYLLILYCHAKTVWGGACLNTGLHWIRIHQKVNYKSKINLSKRISFSNVALTGLNGSSLVMNMVFRVWIPLGNE